MVSFLAFSLSTSLNLISKALVLSFEIISVFRVPKISRADALPIVEMSVRISL